MSSLEYLFICAAEERRNVLIFAVVLGSFFSLAKCLLVSERRRTHIPAFHIWADVESFFPFPPHG